MRLKAESLQVLFFRQIKALLRTRLSAGRRTITYFLLQDIFIIIIIIGCFLFRVMVVDYNKSSKSINAGMVVVDVKEELGIVVVEMELAS